MMTENQKGHPVRAASIAVVVVILLALLVFPGFLAAGLSRAEGEPLSFYGNVIWDDPLHYKEPPLNYRLQYLILAPSGFLMKHSHAVRRFYTRQYLAAGGINEAGED